MKTLRILHLVVTFILLFPIIVLGELWWLYKCIKIAHQLNETTKMGIKYWLDYLKYGIEMNKDFVFNGL